MTPTDTGPVAEVVRVSVSDGNELWVVRCPHCGRPHTHGPGPGHRLAHCGRGGYRLGPDPLDPDNQPQETHP